MKDYRNIQAWQRSHRLALDISLGSLNEIEYLLFLSADLGYIEKKVYQGISEEVVEIRKMLTAFVKTVRKSNRQ